MATIKPTLGRMVWFTPTQHDTQRDDGHLRVIPGNDGKCSAQVVYVHSDRMVNLAVFDANGNHFSRTSVPLIQEGDKKPDGGYCEWMPFQKGQAAKTEEAEAVAKAAREGFTGK